MVKLKICGLVHPEDARLAADFGADYLGFIFHTQSPRCADPRRVKDMGTPGGAGPLKVGVFVDAPIAEVRKIFEEARLDIVQLHGSETPEYIRTLGLPAWKALRTRDESVLREIGRFRDVVNKVAWLPASLSRAGLEHRVVTKSASPQGSPDSRLHAVSRGACPPGVIVLDSYVMGRPGGTGRPFNPVLVRRAIETGAKILVAGGVSATNAAAAVSLGPFGVDVNSSLEKSPGRKCRMKMQRFFEAWRSIQDGNAVGTGEAAPNRTLGAAPRPRQYGKGF